jgi:hypothetical protein
MKCVDCNEIFEIWSKGPYFVPGLIAAVPAIAAMGKLRPDIVVQFDQFNVCGERSGDIPAGWCVKHEGHKLVPFNEYGEDYETWASRLETATRDRQTT